MRWAGRSRRRSRFRGRWRRSGSRAAVMASKFVVVEERCAEEEAIVFDACESTTEMGWREVDRQLRRLAARRGALDVEEARWLSRARAAQIHRHLGFGTFGEYVERVLGYAPRTALERMRVAEALERLPRSRDALTTGQISYSALREFSRIAKPQNEQAWIDAVTGKTVREVEALVAGHEEGDGPEDPADPMLEARHLSLALSPETYALFLQARRHLEAERGEPLSDDDVMASLCEAMLEEGGAASSGPRAQVALTVCERCERGWQDAAGQVIEVPKAAIEMACCDAQQLGRVDGDAPAPTTIDVPAAVRRQVVRRDHGRCVVPGCRASRFLHVHHLIPRAHVGGHEPTNLCLLCSSHHRALHDGRLRITGQPPALQFAHRDGRPYGTPPDRAHRGAPTMPWSASG